MEWPLNLRDKPCKFHKIHLQGFIMATKDLLKLSSGPLKSSLKYAIDIQLEDLKQASKKCSLNFSEKKLYQGFCCLDLSRIMYILNFLHYNLGLDESRNDLLRFRRHL